MNRSEALASFVPESIRREVASGRALGAPWERYGEGAVMLADISGFTRISERLAEQGAKGAETLTRVLNEYFGCLVERVLAFGGDVVQFQGDALLAYWEGEDLARACELAAGCGLSVQQNACDIGIGGHDPIVPQLRLRLSVGAGPVRALHLGGVRGRCEHILVGAAVDEAVRANRQVPPGGVALSATATALLEGRMAGVARSPLSDATLVSGEVPPDPAPLDAPPPLEADAADLLRPFLPNSIVTRLDAGQTAWLAELRRLTAVFVQVPRLDYAATLQDWQAGVIGIQEEMYLREASVNKLTVTDNGSLIVVVAFGLPPLAHDNDPTRAMDAARGVFGRLAGLGLDSTIGVTTGRAFCGAIGNDARREYTMIGDIVNVAARFAQTGASGVLCDEKTYAAAKGSIALEPPQPLVLKGKAEPVRASRLSEGAFATPEAPSPHGQVFGREREQMLLDSALSALEEQGTGATIVLEGEAGMGKSSLLDEVRAGAASRGLRRLEGCGDFVEKNAPYHAWRPIFADLLGASVEDALPEGWRDDAPLLNVLFPGLGLEDNAHTQELVGGARAERTRDLLVAILQASARRTVLVVEDFHWLDSASGTLLAAVHERVAGLLLLVTTRPPGDAPTEAYVALLEAKPQVVRLEPITAEASRALMAQRLGLADPTCLAVAVSDLVHRKAGGHPFFTEELLLALRDAGVVIVEDGVGTLRSGVDPDALDVPDTVQGAVTSRIDRLTPQQQMALKVASVIGSVFGYVVLHDVHPIRGDRDLLRAYLADLTNRDLTVLEAPDPSLTYAFKHAITRDVTYNLMLFEQRRALHRAVAEWYEARYADELAPYSSVLVYHWSRAENLPKALGYLVQASTAAFSAGLGREAVEMGLEGARLLSFDVSSDVASSLARYPEELDRIAKLLDGRAPGDLLDHRPLEDERTALFVRLALAILPFAHQTLQAELYGLLTLMAFRSTLEHGHGPEAAGVYSLYATVYRSLTGDGPTAHAFSRLALDLDARNGRTAFPLVAFVHGWFIGHWVAPLEESLALCESAIEPAFQMGDVLFGCFNVSACVVFRAFLGRPLDEVERTAEEGIQRNGRRVLNSLFHCLHERQVARALAGRTVGPTELSDDETDEARDVASICETPHYNQIGAYFVSKLRLNVLFGKPEEAILWAERALPLLPAFQNQVFEQDLALYRALALLQLGDGEAAQEIVARVRGWAAAGPANFAPMLALLEAESLLAAGGAKADVAAAYDAALEASSGALPPHRALVLERASEAASRLGATDRADRLREAAVAAYGAWGAAAKVEHLRVRALA